MIKIITTIQKKSKDEYNVEIKTEEDENAKPEERELAELLEGGFVFISKNIPEILEEAIKKLDK